jgi:hypothetical protein
MGMDVFGNAPRSDRGAYFRNNVWWWHPLWQYCETVATDIIPDGNPGHSNSGWGLNEAGANALAERLELALRSGHTHRRRRHRYSLPSTDRVVCAARSVLVVKSAPQGAPFVTCTVWHGTTHGTCGLSELMG